MPYRPEGYENYFTFMDGSCIPKYEAQFTAFEAGADEMLDKLRARGKKVTIYGSPGKMDFIEVLIPVETK